MKEVSIDLVFQDWTKDGKSIYQTLKGVDLSLGIFHSGSTFKGKIVLTEDQAKELTNAIKEGYNPVFWIYKEKI